MTNTKSNLAVVLGSAAIVSLMIVFATQRMEEPEEPVEVAAYQFNEEWNAAAFPVLLKSASLEQKPKVVKTEVITLPEAVVLSEEIMAEKPKHIEVKRDICQRHKMRKVRQGKSWRCKR